MTSFALWYLENIKASKGDLYPRFMDDLGPDSEGRPLTVQDIIATRAFISISQRWNTYLPTISQEQNLTDAQNYAIMKNALLNTANPVILYLYHKTCPPDVPCGAHSVLAYGYNSDGLLIYDVNEPGTTQSIGFDPGTSKFIPYDGFDGIIFHGDGSFAVTEPYINNSC
jgi:hypothetical protein